MPEFAPFSVYSIYSLISAVGDVNTYTWATLPTTAQLDTVAILDDTLAGSTYTLDMRGVVLKYLANDPAEPWEPIGTARYLGVNGTGFTSVGTNTWQDGGHFTMPAAITLTGQVEGAYYSSSASNTNGVALGTTSAGSDIVSVSGSSSGNVHLIPTTASGTTSIAASAALYLSYKAYDASGTDAMTWAAWRFAISKMAGQAT